MCLVTAVNKRWLYGCTFLRLVYRLGMTVKAIKETVIWKTVVWLSGGHLASTSSHYTNTYWRCWTAVELIIYHLLPPGIKPFQCDRCGKKFTRAYSLKMHRLKHEGKRCFRCQICSATFTSFGEYKHHMRVSRHIIRKPRIYECKTCGAMFTNSGNLIVHLRSLNHEASELANYFQSRWGVWGCWPSLFTQISPGAENILIDPFDQLRFLLASVLYSFF